MNAHEVRSRLLILINEFKAQRDIILYEFDGVDDFEQQVQSVQRMAQSKACGPAFEWLIRWFEQLPVTLCSANVVFLVELALHFGYKTNDAADARFHLRKKWPAARLSPPDAYDDDFVPIASAVKEFHEKLPEVESRLAKLIDEVEAQRENIIFEFRGVEGFKQHMAWVRGYFPLFKYRWAYERLIGWYEQMPIRVCGPNAVYMVELALHFGLKTAYSEDVRFDLRRHWLRGCPSGVFKP